MASIDIIKPLSTVLSSALNKFQQHQEKNYWERWAALLPCFRAAGLLGCWAAGLLGCWAAWQEATSAQCSPLSGNVCSGFRHSVFCLGARRWLLSYSCHDVCGAISRTITPQLRHNYGSNRPKSWLKNACHCRGHDNKPNLADCDLRNPLKLKP